jgi:general secretion pathway protein K
MKAISSLTPRRGFVLVSVLWTMALLSALAMAAAVSFRGFAGVLAIDRDRVQADALLSAGLELGADLLIKHRGRALAPVSTSLALSTGVVSVQLTDELGKIDINRAPIEVFASLLMTLDIANSAEAARAIVRWRDGEVKMKQEKTRSQSTQQGSVARGPGGAPKAEPPPEPHHIEPVFTNVDQLAQIPGVSLNDARLIEPYATVFGDDTVNALTASPQVLRALPEMNDARISRLLEARDFRPLDLTRIEQVLGPASLYLKSNARSVARLEITARLSNGFTAAAEAVIVALAKDQQPYRVLAFAQLPATRSGDRNF